MVAAKMRSLEGPANVRFGSLADVRSAKRHVRFTPNSDRKSRHAQMVMSALPLKADMCTARGHVCFGPRADIPANSSVALSSGNACNARIDFVAKCPEVDWFGKKRFGPTLQRLPFGLSVTIGGDHNDRYIGSRGLGFRQKFQTRHARHIDV